jgi:hypothetical protein
MKMSLASSRRGAGVAVIDLTFAHDVVRKIKVGVHRIGYIIDAEAG